MKILMTTLLFLSGALASFASGPEIPKDYPLATCPISGERLGSGGMVPYKVTHDGTDVWLCCKMCKGRFEKDADRHVKDVREAAAKAKKD